MSVVAQVETPLGAIWIAVHSGRITKITLPGGDDPHGDEPVPGTADAQVLERAARQLRAYAAGSRDEFDLPLGPQGTEFQRACWEALQEIPYGETRSYAEIAARIGRPGAARAVGQANRRNPIPIVVPCHRVVTADGGLGGYMGRQAPEDGLKARLLEMEARRD